MLSEVEWYRSTDLRRVVALAQESLSVSREIRSYWVHGSVLCWLGTLALKAEDNKAAQAYLEEYLTLAREIRVRPTIFLVLLIAAVLAFRQGKLTQSATLLATAEAHCEDVPGYRKHFDFDRQFAAARTPLDGPEFAAAWTKGRTMVVDQAVLDDLDILSDNDKFFD